MAKDLGLVDALGSLDEAIRMAGQMGGVSGKPHVVRARRGWRLLDMLDLAGGESALSWLRSVGWVGPAVGSLPILSSPQLPLYLLH
jgi:ClpP class serine protease